MTTPGVWPVWLALCCCTAALLMSPAAAQIVMTYSVQRHGARNVLPKTALLKEGDLIGGPTLLPQGQKQCYDAGAAFRARYINDSSCGTTCLKDNGYIGSGDNYGVYGQSGVGYGNFDVYVRSSSLDRTIMSAFSFFNGLFPAINTPNSTFYIPTGNQIVPVYTERDDDDILIRAYTKCNTYNDRLTAFYESDEFKAKSENSSALRAQVKAVMPSTDTSLTNWWNVYDAINVYRTYGVGEPTPTFDNPTFAKIAELANWLETVKMRSNLTGNLLGGVLLGDILANMQTAVTAVTNSNPLFYKLPSISSHYNTQLAVLSALEMDKFPAAASFTWFTTIPKLAAHMVFELYGNANVGFSVRLVAQDGPAASYATIPLPCSTTAPSGSLPGSCTFADFMAYAAPRAISTEQEWCVLCNNSDAPTCVSNDRLLDLQQLQSKKGSEDRWKIIVAGVVSGVGMLVLCLVIGAFIFLKAMNDPKNTKFASPMEMAHQL